MLFNVTYPQYRRLIERKVNQILLHREIEAFQSFKVIFNFINRPIVIQTEIKSRDLFKPISAWDLEKDFDIYHGIIEREFFRNLHYDLNLLDPIDLREVIDLLDNIFFDVEIKIEGVINFIP